MNRLAVLLLVLLCAAAAQAMTVEVQGRVVFATGPVVDDLAKFQAAFDKPGVDTVAFVNSPGGDLWTGLRVGRLIAERGFHTVIGGACVSACSIMFMGGKTRSFSDVYRPLQTYIGIHGAHRVDTKVVDPILQPQIFAFYKLNMGDRFNADIMNKALYDMDDAGALLRVYDAQRQPNRVTFHCKSVQTLRKDCTEFKGADALNIGIVTTNAPTALDLPAVFKQSTKVLGRDLQAPLVDPAEFFSALSAKACNSDGCRKLLADFAVGPENKALATPVAGAGLGTATNQDTAVNAYIRAIYNCNHVRGQPARLCEAQVSNGFDARPLYAEAAASQTEAIAKLTVAPNKFYANEEFGGGLTTATGLRTQKVHDITPKEIDGIKTYSTQALSAALKSSEPPVVVDVWGGANDVIPSAVTLLFGGLAFDDAQGDAVYETRFAGLLKLLSPDSVKPVVFYCVNRDCWLSANAAMRAKKLGYTNVGWYRGGFDSWRAAELPVAMIAVRAVVR